MFSLPLTFRLELVLLEMLIIFTSIVFSNTFFSKMLMVQPLLKTNKRKQIEITKVISPIKKHFTNEPVNEWSYRGTFHKKFSAFSKYYLKKYKCKFSVIDKLWKKRVEFIISKTIGFVVTA